MDGQKLNNTQISVTKNRLRNFKRPHLSRVGMIVVLLVLLLALGGTYLIIANNNNRSKESLKTRCRPDSDASITKDAAIILDASKNGSLRDLGKAIEPILADPEHEKDPNCMYPIVRYYLSISDAEKSKTAFVKFEQVYEKGFADDLYFADLESLRGQVDHQAKITEEAGANMLFSDPVEEQ